MKKIKNLEHLSEEKRRLRNREKELKELMNADWDAVKKNLHPAQLVKNAWNGFSDKKAADPGKAAGTVKDKVNSVLETFGKKLVGKILDKISDKYSK